MAKKNKKKIKNKKEKKIKLGTSKETAREKMIGQHIGYRYDVNMLPDYKKITPFLKKYVEAMGWDDLNWLEDVHMGYKQKGFEILRKIILPHELSNAETIIVTNSLIGAVEGKLAVSSF